MVLWSTQPLTEMSTRNLPGAKGRLARKADNLTPSVSLSSTKCGSLDVSQSYGPPRPVTGIPLPFLRLLLEHKVRFPPFIYFTELDLIYK
jgi:hypothetical protein